MMEYEYIQLYTVQTVRAISNNTDRKPQQQYSNKKQSNTYSFQYQLDKAMKKYPRKPTKE